MRRVEDSLSARGLKKTLENLEMLDHENKRKKGKQVPKMDDATAEMLSDLKKIEEIKRMFRYLHPCARY
jgi:hypothetical protein